MTDDKITAKQRYDRTWPPISIRVSKETHDLLKNLAKRRGVSIGRFCGDILMLQHCGNCHRVFNRKQPPKVVEELQSSLKAALEDIKVYQEKNMALTIDLEDWQGYTVTLHQKIESLTSNVDKFKREISRFQSELSTQKSIQDDSDVLKRQNVGLLARIQSLEDVIQGHKDSKAALQRESVEFKDTIYILEEKVAELQGCKKRKADLRQRNDALQRKVKKWEVQWNTVTGDVSDRLKEVADDVGISQSEVVRDMIAVGLRHTNDIYFEDLEAQ